ncbi:Molybdopterin_biosynthesis MoeB protein [Hexamita inflata]|uniref:Molybdopterin biosynthesis MoeB protein n=1 Tax=Hexamita inflata TaxID=28002 RepID=A0AA86Q3R2_9EUKA|nr:Molybdopterin biosynthesis MoeB protein [Hexamita inflata]
MVLPRLELGSLDSESKMLTNYTIGPYVTYYIEKTIVLFINILILSIYNADIKRSSSLQLQMNKYLRQQTLKEFTKEQEQCIHESSVCCIGAGGVAASFLEFIVGAGIKQLIIVDFDTVDKTNLHRQVLHSEIGADKKLNKALSAKERLNNLNSDVDIVTIQEKLTPANISCLDDYSFQVMVDATDNPETRFLVAEYCFKRKIPHIYAAAVCFTCYVSTFNVVLDQPCFKCFFPKIPPQNLRQTAATDGVFGPVVGVAGCQAAAECLKVLTYQNTDESIKRENLLIGKMMIGNVLTNNYRIVRLSTKKDCMCQKLTE